LTQRVVESTASAGVGDLGSAGSVQRIASLSTGLDEIGAAESVLGTTFLEYASFSEAIALVAGGAAARSVERGD